MRGRLCAGAALLLAWATTLPAGAPTPVELWRDYDPDRGEFKEEVVKESVAAGVRSRDSYISAYVLGEEVRVFCKYAVKDGARQAPGLLDVHGWMGTANVDRAYVADGWAVMAFDYCGKSAGREHYTRYPAALDYGRMEGKVIHSRLPDGHDITDPKQTSHYLWFALQRRVLSYLLAQREVDRGRIGAKGYSYGGTLMWNLGMDPRVKAVVAFFGIGWIEYYRNKAVWLYNVPYVEPPMTPGERLFLATVEAQSHAPYITAATLWLNGSNDHHGGHERSEQTFKQFRPDVPWSFAIQARGHHNTEKLGDDCRLWLEKHVLGRAVAWPRRPAARLALGADGVPELHVTPDSPERLADVQAYYALKTPTSFARYWRDTPAVRQGDEWVAKLPVLNVDDYVFGYANLRYEGNLVLSTDFGAAIPSKLGHAVATDRPASETLDGIGGWSDIGPAEGVGAVKGFRALNNQRGTASEQFADPKWQAPAKAALTFRFFCTEPQTIVLTADNQYQAELALTAADTWQSLVLPAERLSHRQNKQPLRDWSRVTAVQLTPRAGSDLTKVVFAQVHWVKPD